MTAAKSHSKIMDTTIHTGYSGATRTTELDWYEYAIKGRMIVASLALSEGELVLLSKDEIKKRLAIQLAEGMLEEGCIEYTQGHDWTNHSVMIRARAFVVPSADVKLLRVSKT